MIFNAVLHRGNLRNSLNLTYNFSYMEPAMILNLILLTFQNCFLNLLYRNYCIETLWEFKVIQLV